MISPTETAPQRDYRAPSPPPTPADAPKRPTPTRKPVEIKGLVNGLVDDLRHWFRQEIRLARVEAMENVSDFGKQAANAAAGGAVLFLGAVLLLLAAGFGVGALFLMLGWNIAASFAVSFLIVGLVTLLIGWGSLNAAKKRMKLDHLKPERTLRTLHNAKETAKDKLP